MELGQTVPAAFSGKSSAFTTLSADSSRVSSIEHDSRYKRTWAVGGADVVADANGSKVVSRQPSGVRNGQTVQVNAGGTSGPYIKRWVLGLIR